MDSKCPMTAGYYIGGGLWVCWLHAVFSSSVYIAIKGKKMQAFPTE